MREKRLEVRCSADVVHCLGVLKPNSNTEHRKLRDAGHLLVRDHETMSAFFWPWLEPVAMLEASTRSS